MSLFLKIINKIPSIGQILKSDIVDFPEIPIDKWERKNDITNITPIVANQAIYFLTWETPTFSEDWDNNLSRAVTDRLKNLGTEKKLIQDTVFAEIQSGALDFANVTYCYAEMFLLRYDSNDTLIETTKFGGDKLPSINTGTWQGWGVGNLIVQGNIGYTLQQNEYSKIMIVLNYDGSSNNVTIADCYHQHINLIN